MTEEDFDKEIAKVTNEKATNIGTSSNEKYSQVKVGNDHLTQPSFCKRSSCHLAYLGASLQEDNMSVMIYALRLKI